VDHTSDMVDQDLLELNLSKASFADETAEEEDEEFLR
jgi:hypothetical protein